MNVGCPPASAKLKTAVDVTEIVSAIMTFLNRPIQKILKPIAKFRLWFFELIELLKNLRMMNDRTCNQLGK